MKVLAHPAERDDLRILVLAPRGRDGDVVRQMLDHHGLHGVKCVSLADFVTALRDGAGLAFVTEEALTGDDLSALTAWLAAQPPWSDLPLVVLATRQAGRRSAQALARLQDLGNVVLLERPLDAETLVSAARAALRSRTRQYDSRRQLDDQARIGRDNERLHQAERMALRSAAEAREQLLDTERVAREEAEHASRTKDEFLATLSHELRTPLSVILGWVQLLRKRGADSAELARGIDTIERNARAQARLIDELLDMSRIIAGNVHLELQPLMPSTVLDAVLASLQPGIDAKSIHIERDIDASLGPVSADAHRLQQVVWNLLSNAVKFTPAQGRIAVSLRPATDHPMPCAALTIEITDSGEGIAPDFLPFVFDRFRQADGSSTRQHGGLGLGLAIVRQLVELHGGSVQARSAGLGRGAAFAVSLPLLAAGSLAALARTRAAGIGVAGDAGAEPVVAPLKGLRVVLVDDDADGRDIIARVLGDGGARVHAATSAEDALATLRNGVAPHVLVSDIRMPLTDGYELLRRVRCLGYRMPVIALTAFARPEERQRALAAGFALHLAKPVEPAELLSSIARLGKRELAADTPTPCTAALPSPRTRSAA